MGGMMGGTGFGFGLIGLLLNLVIIVGIVVLVIWAVRQFSSNGQGSSLLGQQNKVPFGCPGHCRQPAHELAARNRAASRSKNYQALSKPQGRESDWHQARGIVKGGRIRDVSFV